MNNVSIGGEEVGVLEAWLLWLVHCSFWHIDERVLSSFHIQKFFSGRSRYEPTVCLSMLANYLSVQKDAPYIWVSDTFIDQTYDLHFPRSEPTTKYSKLVIFPVRLRDLCSNHWHYTVPHKYGLTLYTGYLKCANHWERSKCSLICKQFAVQLLTMKQPARWNISLKDNMLCCYLLLPLSA